MNRATAEPADLRAIDAHRSLSPLDRLEEDFAGATEAPPSYVYFIGPITAGSPIKIGKTNNPMLRLQTLQTAHWEPLCIFALFPESAITEKQLHDHLGGFRMRGEWFHGNPVRGWLNRVLAKALT